MGYQYGQKSIWETRPESLDMLKDCIALRMSASETAAKMAAQFGIPVTANMCVSKAKRTKLRFDSPSSHNTFAKHGFGKARPSRAAAPKPEKLHKTVFHVRAEPAALSAEPVAIPESRRVSIGELTFKSCRWPIGDPRHADFAFCGAERVNPFDAWNAYCAGHAAIAYRPTGPVNMRPVRQANSVRAGVQA